MSGVNETVKLDSVMNFRDLSWAGSPQRNKIRPGLIFRSANPDKIGRKDIKKLRMLGVSTIIDLRGEKEAKQRRKKIDGIEYISIPMDFEQRTRELIYPLIKNKKSVEEILEASQKINLEIADAAPSVLAGISDILLSKPGEAVLIHCQAGKDRTGIISAMFHMLAGTERNLIVDEYLLSNNNLIPYFRKMMIMRKIITFGRFPAETVLFVVQVKKENIEAVMDRIINHHGGIEQCLVNSGFGQQKIERLKEAISRNGN